MKTNKRDTRIFTGLFALCWLILISLGYLYIHKPFLPKELIGILAIIWRTLISLGILSLAGGVGVLTKVREWNVPPLANAMLTCAIGLGIMGVFIFIVASTLGVAFPLWIFLLIAGLALRKPVVIWWGYWRNTVNLWREIGYFGYLLLIPIVILLACQYLEALAPPLHFDALTYHLALPKAYLQLGRIAYLPDNIFWGMPQLIEMLYMLAMSLGGPEAAVILGWWLGILALIGLADFVKNIYGTNAAWVAVAGLMAGSGMTTSLSSGYIEWASMLFGLSMLICLFQWITDGENLMLGVSGVFAGLAMSTKYTNGIILIAGMTAILLFYKPASWKQLLLRLIGFGSAATLVMLPWLIKNVMATSNPFYPLFIPSGAMDAILLDFYQFKPMTQDWTRVLLLPWQATIMGVDGGEGFSSSIGPLLLGLSPLAWMRWRDHSPEQRTATKLCGSILVAGFLIWAIGSQFRGLLIQTRLYFVLFPAWAILAAAGYMNIARINSHNIRFGNLAGALILLALAFNAFSTSSAVAASNPILTILNLEDRASYIKRHLGGYTDAMQTVASLPQDAKVILLWETRSLECLPKCDPDEIIGRWYHDWSIHRNQDRVIQSWKNQGYSHVLLNHDGADFVRKYDANAPSAEYWEGLRAVLKNLTPVEMDASGYQLYQIP